MEVKREEQRPKSIDEENKVEGVAVMRGEEGQDQEQPRTGLDE